MINLDKFNSQVDLNSFDASQIIKLLTENKKIIRIVFIAAALAIAWGMFNDHHVKQAALQTQISQAQAKLDVIKQRDAAIQDLTNFKSSLTGPMDQFQLMTQISNDANLYNVTIATLNPPDTQDMGLYDTLDFKFTAVADNFRDMMLFLRSIEKSVPPLRVNVWTGQADKDGRISSDIELSAVHIHP